MVKKPSLFAGCMNSMLVRRKGLLLCISAQIAKTNMSHVFILLNGTIDYDVLITISYQPSYQCIELDAMFFSVSALILLLFTYAKRCLLLAVEGVYLNCAHF